MEKRSLNDILDDLDFEIVRGEPYKIEIGPGGDAPVTRELKWGGNNILATAVASKNPADFLTASFFRSVVKLRAAIQLDKFIHYNLMIIIKTDSFSEKMYLRYKKIFETFASEFLWLVISGGEPISFSEFPEKIHQRTEKKYPEKESTSVVERLTDLDILLLKSVTFGSYKNLNCLSKEVNVSSGKVYEWAKKIRGAGWLDQRGDELKITGLDEIICKLAENHGLQAAKLIESWRVEGDLESKLEDLPGDLNEKLIVTGEAAMKLKAGENNFSKLEMYSSVEDKKRERLQKLLGAQSVIPGDANVFIYEISEGNKNVTTYIEHINNIAVADNFQISMDTSKDIESEETGG